MNGAYITYHAFFWQRAKNKFVESILALDGDVLMETKAKGHYLLKVSNPCTHMKTHPKWASSNAKFWKLPTEVIKLINPNTTNK